MTTGLLTPSGKGIENYLASINKFPLLSEKEEYMLAKRWQTKSDAKAARKLITSHLRLVAKIAFGYRGYKLPIEDLISEGNVGLMKAVKKFDPDKGFRLATYAMWWIRAQIQEYVLHSWSLVKIGTTAAQKKLFFNLKKLKNQIDSMNDGSLSPENVREIASRLNVKEAEVMDMENRLFTGDKSLNVQINDEADTEWQDLIADDKQTQDIVVENKVEYNHRKKIFEDALGTLKPREREIIQLRRLKDKPDKLKELSKKYNISRERVRQIEEKAISKLKEKVSEIL